MQIKTTVAVPLDRKILKETGMFFEEDFWFMDKKGFDPYLADIPKARRGQLYRNRAIKIRAQIARWEERVAMANPPFKQAQHLIAKFGGIVPFSVAIGKHPNHIILYYLGITIRGSVFKDRTSWRRGLIPHSVLARLIVVARYWGVYLTPADLFPQFVQDPQYLKPLAAKKEFKEWIKLRHQKSSYSAFEDVVASLVLTSD